MMRAVFVMVKVEPGQVEAVAQRIGNLDAFSEGYSISGAYDLLVKFYIETSTIGLGYNTPRKRPLFRPPAAH